jgi:biofilm protein TabA
MIHSTLDQIGATTSASRHFKTAADYLRSTDLRSLPVGKFAIDGDLVFGIVMEYETRMADAAKWETHRKYIDIQIMLDGREEMRWADVNGLSEKTPYDADKDATFYHSPTTYQTLSSGPGEFVVFEPADAHAPSLMIGMPAKVRKLVIKVSV